MRTHPTVTGILLLASCLGIAGCDTLYFVSARTPLVTPLDSSCIHSTLRQLTGHDIRYRAREPGVASVFESHGAPKRERRRVTQVLDASGGGRLETEEVRISQTFRSGEADTLGAVHLTLLHRVRESCQGEVPSTQRAIVVHSQNDPTYEMWTVSGTDGRVLGRWTMEGMVPNPRRAQHLRLDTLAYDSNPDLLRYLPVDSLRLPSAPKGYAVATDCWRGDSLHPGRVVAVARTTTTAFLNDVIGAWDVDRNSPRIVPGNPGGVTCRNRYWTTSLVAASWGEHASALTFKPSPGRARIYVYRSSDRKWGATLNVAIDSSLVGQLTASTFVMVEVMPGSHSISSPGERERFLWLDTREGVSYFIRLWPRLGWRHARAGSETVEAATARGEILSAQMVRSVGPRSSPRGQP